MCSTLYGVCLITGTGSTFTPQTKMAHWPPFQWRANLAIPLGVYRKAFGLPKNHTDQVSEQSSQMHGVRTHCKKDQRNHAQLGIPTEAFKAQSLLGATATHLMLNVMAPQWVQSRGGWKSPETMQIYYNRIHQQQDWEAALQGKTDAIKHCFNCVVPALTFSQTEAEEGRQRGGKKGKAQHR